MLTSVVMFAAMRLVISREDDYLAQKYGQQYAEYRMKVLINFL